MDKRVIFAVAGSGKTTFIINSLSLESNSLIVTFTNNNLHSLKTRIIDKFGYLPNNIKIFSYYSFLHSFCYKPFLSNKFNSKGINYTTQPSIYLKQTDIKYYLDKNRRLYSSRISKLLILENILGELNNRLSKYFDDLYIDEVQDFAGNDFNLLKSIAKANLKILFVGDFYQHTFDTSRDGIVNKNLHINYVDYQNEFRKMGMTIDLETLNKSYRCSPKICKFISDKINIFIESHKELETNIFIIDTKEDALLILENNEIVKLFYQEHYKYSCFSRNWGDSKGEDKYQDVCVILNKTTLEHFVKDNLNDLKPITKNKLYVAISRTKNKLYFLPEKLIKEIKAK
jgi:DNA helicase-2/ATP-dependent DNA helicase PcrA